MDWDKERNGWYDSNGYHVVIENDQFNAMTPWNKPIAIGMPSLETAKQWVDYYKRKNFDGFGVNGVVGTKPIQEYHEHH